MGFPCRFIPVNVFDLAVLTSTIAPYATLGLDNLKNDSRSQICRWPAAGGAQAIKGHWRGASYPVSGVALDRFNLEPAATVRFRGWANSDWTGTLLIDTGTVAAYNSLALGNFTWGVDPLGSSIFDGYRGYKYFVAWMAEQSIASFQWDISDTTNSWGYAEVARAVVGKSVTTTYNADFGIQSGWIESTELEEMDGGALLSDARVPRRGLTGNLGFLTPAERQIFYELTGYVGKRKTFLASFQVGEAASMERDFTIPVAKFLELPQPSWIKANTHALPFKISEA